MKIEENPITIKKWLLRATWSLPAHLQPVISEELNAHYQDSFHAYLNQGFDIKKANTYALLELGDPKAVNKRYLSIFISNRRILLTILACAFYFLMLLIFPVIMNWVGPLFSYVIHDFLSTLILIFILSSFIRLIGKNINTLYKPSGLLMTSLMLGTIVRCAFLFFFNDLPFNNMESDYQWWAGSHLNTGLHIGFILAELLAALASCWLGFRLFAIKLSLYGLMRPIQYIFLFIGLFSAGVAVSLLLANMMIAYLFTVLGYIMVTILLALMILMFYRARFQEVTQT